jgi:hypothetical protein
MQVISSHKVKSYLSYVGVVLSTFHTNCLHSVILTGDILLTFPGDILSQENYHKVMSTTVSVLRFGYGLLLSLGYSFAHPRPLTL